LNLPPIALTRAKIHRYQEKIVRHLTYAQAINEAQDIAMSNDPKVIQIGQGINSPWYVGILWLV
jgi:hypothetical protein